MSIYEAALNNTLDLTQVGDDTLAELLASLDESGWELSYAMREYEPHEFDALNAPIRAALARIRAELARRTTQALDAAWSRFEAAEAEHRAMEDGRHTLVG